MTTKGPRARAQPAKAAPTGRLKKLRLDLVYPNPQQPRKDFDETKLAELAASIRTHGLLQPIGVRPDSMGTYMVICGERRYRAHLLAGMKEITAHVDGVDDQSVFEQSIVENLQRVDITPLEEGHAFKTCLEMSGGEPAALAQRLGLKQPWRITERLSLLTLRDDYQAMLARGTLGPSQAYEMSRLPPPLQDELLRLIRAGACDSYNRLRASAEGLLQRDKQGELLERTDPPTAQEQAALSGLERLVEKLCALLSKSFSSKEMVLVKKINPYRAGVVADQIKVIQQHLSAMEKMLRATAVATAAAGGGG